MRTITAVITGFLILTGLLFLLAQSATAAPFGKGVFGADVPYGSLTSLSIDFNTSVSMILAPSGPNFYGTGSQTVTVTSTDVVGYSLYVHNPTSPAMQSGSDSIPASSNVTPGALAVNTWGYNTNGSANFKGLTTSQAMVTDKNGPFKNGDVTTVTYGALVNSSKTSGTYTVDITYTAIGKS